MTLMNNSKIKISGILLAGGMSKRMGREKGIMKIGDQFLYHYPLKVLEDICDEIMISTCKNSAMTWDYPTVCDEMEGIGPMGGIYTCLKASANDINIVLSYDMPLVSKELLEYLLGEIENYDLVVPALSPHRPEPLCAVYRKRMTGILKDLMDQHIYAVHKAIPHARSKTIILKENISFYRENIFLNINQEEDLIKLPRTFK